MRYLYFVIFLGVSSLPVFAQSSTPLSENDKKEIKIEALRVIEIDLSDLLNGITSDEMGEITRKLLKANSFIPSDKQIFDIGAVVEDDINPEYSVSKKGTDVRIQRYLDNIDLFYAKTPGKSITLSQINPGEVIIGTKYPFILVHFKIEYGSFHRNKPDLKYAPIMRIAELKAERSENQWKVLITGIRYDPDAPTEVVAPSIPIEIKKEAEPVSQAAPPEKDEDAGKTGYKFEDAIVAETKNVSRNPLLMAYRINDTWGLLVNENQNKKVLTQPLYCEIEEFVEGLAVVCKDGRWGYINTGGEEVNCCKYDNAEAYIKGKAKVQLGVKSLTIDISGKELK